MKKPVLVIMAAGMGSRYGGLKQIDPVSDRGEIILDFSLYDAMMAGFKDAIFIIRKEHRKAFDELMRDRAGKHLNIKYAFQELTDLPDGYTVPEGREKPWGTCHAVLSARKLIDRPFAVINADDYYGPDAFMKIYDFLNKSQEETAGGHGSGVGAAKPGDSEFRGRENERRAENEYTFAMVGYKLSNTLTENGHVSRGICEVSSDGYLAGITERTKIMKKDGDIVFLGEDGETWEKVSPEATASMNFWGFTKHMIGEMEKAFPKFLDQIYLNDPLKGEYYLPTAVESLIDDGKATVRVLRSSDRWYGVTYKEDKPSVTAALRAMKDKGLYPEKLWL